MDRQRFASPEAALRLSPMTHNWPEDRASMFRALDWLGHGRVVTNVPGENGFTRNPENIARFGEILRDIRARGLKYWIYDEKGYPSGYGAGATLEGHPELEAAGIYMRRFAGYEPHTVHFRLEEGSTRIVWAAKYPFCGTGIQGDQFPDIQRMQPVPFTRESCECPLEENELLYIFCEKPAYEGSHLTHNVCSRSRYINVLDARAVRRFIDLCYEPIAAALPEAFPGAEGVFTDEPSLEVAYLSGGEDENQVWQYALAPWVYDLFDRFRERYGYPLEPYLPLLFEGSYRRTCKARVDFHRLIGALFARNFTGQLQSWCAAHGTSFSGHYLLEENLWTHVAFSGDLLPVWRQTGTLGVDVLTCAPESYPYSTAKYAQMAARTKHETGEMVELCPFMDKPAFDRQPVGNIRDTIDMLASGSVRVFHSYWQANYKALQPSLPENNGYPPEDVRGVGEYTGRVCAMLEGLENRSGVFIYFGIEDTQAKYRPLHCMEGWPPAGRSGDADRATDALSGAVYEAGHDFWFADRVDLAGAEYPAGGLPTITGQEVRYFLLPTLDVLAPESLEALRRMEAAGAVVLCAGHAPTLGADGVPLPADCLPTATVPEILARLEKDDGDPLRFDAGKAVIIRTRYEREGRPLYFLCNHTRTDASLRWTHPDTHSAQVWDPLDGSVRETVSGEPLAIPALSGVFLWLRP